jgi:hypothetical protein
VVTIKAEPESNLIQHEHQKIRAISALKWWQINESVSPKPLLTPQASAYCKLVSNRGDCKINGLKREALACLTGRLDPVAGVKDEIR